MAWYKTASSGKKTSNAPVFENAGKGQKAWTANLGDYQRWVVDAYEVSVYLSETNYKFAVSVTVNKVHLGTIMLQIFWKYSLDEKSKAEKTYKEVCYAVGKIFDELSDTESPSSLYESMIRHDCHEIDKEHIAKTTNPIINYSHDIKYERDWRTSLYGNRYPKPNETNAY